MLQVCAHNVCLYGSFDACKMSVPPVLSMHLKDQHHQDTRRYSRLGRFFAMVSAHVDRGGVVIGGDHGEGFPPRVLGAQRAQRDALGRGRLRPAVDGVLRLVGERAPHLANIQLRLLLACALLTSACMHACMHACHCQSNRLSCPQRCRPSSDRAQLTPRAAQPCCIVAVAVRGHSSRVC